MTIVSFIVEIVLHATSLEHRIEQSWGSIEKVNVANTELAPESQIPG
jgi:hypothetical protein